MMVRNHLLVTDFLTGCIASPANFTLELDGQWNNLIKVKHGDDFLVSGR